MWSLRVISSRTVSKSYAVGHLAEEEKLFVLPDSDHRTSNAASIWVCINFLPEALATICI